jgi:hypothetical protein
MTGAARKLPELFITEERGRRAGAGCYRHGQLPALCERVSPDGLSPEDRDRIAVDLAQQAADVR